MTEARQRSTAADQPDTRWPIRVADASAVAGAIGWLAIVAADALGPIREIIALAMLVLVPLALRIADTPCRDGTRSIWYRLAVLSQPIAAVPGVLSLSMPTGPAAALTALPWALATLPIAGFGAWRLLGRGSWPVEELSVDAGLVYVVVGGVALLLDRAGIALSFQPIIVTLTIVHFHYAGSALPILSGIAGRYAPDGRFGTVLRTTTAIIILGPGLIAVGITASAFGLPFAGAVEFLAVAFFTTAVALFSVSVTVGVCPRISGRLQRLLIGVASVSVTVSMAFAVCYGLARATGGSYLGIGPQSFGLMVSYHGQLNAYGFAVPALVGWRLAVPDSRARPPGIPYSRLGAGRRVGADFLARRGLTTDSAATGMVDDLSAYGHDDFDPGAVSSDVAHFYEHSGEYSLAVDPDWAWPWGRLAALYRIIATRIGQLSLPLAPVAGEAALAGRVVGVDSDDPETGDRAWIRSNADRVADDRQMTYVGIYDRYVGDGRPFLRVAFPLPTGNLTGILRFENGGSEGDGVVLTSHPVAGNGDDAGLSLVVAGFGIRLPLNETFVVEPAGESVRAIHRVELFGVRLFTLRYEIRPVE